MIGPSTPLLWQTLWVFSSRGIVWGMGRRSGFSPQVFIITFSKWAFQLAGLALFAWFAIRILTGPGVQAAGIDLGLAILGAVMSMWGSFLALESNREKTRQMELDVDGKKKGLPPPKSTDPKIAAIEVLHAFVNRAEDYGRLLIRAKSGKASAQDVLEEEESMQRLWLDFRDRSLFLPPALLGDAIQLWMRCDPHDSLSNSMHRTTMIFDCVKIARRSMQKELGVETENDLLP